MGNERDTKGQTSSDKRVDDEKMIPTCENCKKIMLLCKCSDNELEKA